MDCSTQETYFDVKYATLISHGLSFDEASLEVVEAYLDGKPHKKTQKQHINKNKMFWCSKLIWDLNAGVLNTDTFVLALARYFIQEQVSNFSLLEHITRLAPETMLKGIRRSEIVLRPNSNKWIEVKQLAERIPSALNALISVCEAFQRSHKERQTLVAKFQAPFKDLTVFELLSYSSVYAFKYLLIKPDALDGSDISTDDRFRALKKLVEWKLSIAKPDSFLLTEMGIAQSLKQHQSPLVFPSQEDSSIPEFFLYHFEKLMQAQVELNGFLSRSVTPFCFDDECEYYLNGDRLEMRKHSEHGDKIWQLNGKKQSLLDGFWFGRGVDELVNRGMANTVIGSYENHEANQIAYAKSLGAYLQLSEIYGLDKTVLTDNGLNVDVHQALLSLELMVSFYNKAYIEVYISEHSKVGDWQIALGMLALTGLLDQSNMQNRLPMTWQNWKQKAKNIVGWTVSDTFPKGNIKAAEAILDFWSLDFKKWSGQLKASNTENLPQLTERPIFKLGNYSVQLPWMMASQLTNVNAINTLRRFANKRPELKSETSRIESNLGNQFKQRGFTVIESYQPERREGFNPGEIDLICALDDVVLVIEVKSTYRRSSLREAIGYKNNALRKAGIQIKRKVDAVKQLMRSDNNLLSRLGGNATDTCKVIGWIADTSLEHDHEYFNGYLKVSIDELHIALADNADLLADLIELGMQGDRGEEVISLYPDGFSAEGFVDVIGQSKVWATKLNMQNCH